MWQAKKIIHRDIDGSYVIQQNGHPYHVPNEGDFAALWAKVDAWAREHPEQVEIEYPPAPPTLEEAKRSALSTIDRTTRAAILAGFDYEIDPGTGTKESLHFAYDSFDQQNFADTANMATLLLSGAAPAGEGSAPSSGTWNAYRNWSPKTGGELVRLVLDPAAFLALYTQGALAHKTMQMDIGGQRKALIAACESKAAITALLQEWGLV